MAPLVSIITPLYNAEQYLAQTIESVLSQTYRGWELIIVDDLSTDNSYPIAKQYAAKDARIKLIQRDTEIGGGSVCRNLGIKASEGDYIIFLDADDLLYDKCLENRINYIKKNKNLDFCVFQMEMISPDGEKQNKHLTHKEDNYLYAFLSYRLPWQTTCPIWKSEFVKDKLHGFDERYPRLQDPEFHTRALLIDNVNFKVYDAVQYLDCLYRVGYKKMNLSIFLKGSELYATTMSERIKMRPDYLSCIDALAIFYDDIMNHYTLCSIKEMKDNLYQIKNINNLFLFRKIIKTELYYKTLLFTYYIKYNFFKLRAINFILRQLGFQHFFYYQFSKME